MKNMKETLEALDKEYISAIRELIDDASDEIKVDLLMSILVNKVTDDTKKKLELHDEYCENTLRLSQKLGNAISAASEGFEKMFINNNLETMGEAVNMVKAAIEDDAEVDLGADVESPPQNANENFF